MARAELQTTTYCILSLSLEEADYLMSILRRIGGDPKKSRRSHGEEILRAIEQAGITPKTAQDMSGSISILDNLEKQL